MKIEIPDEYLSLLPVALDHYYAFTRAVQRDNSAYKEAADFFRAKLPKEQDQKPRPARK